MGVICNLLHKSQRAISFQNGIVRSISKASRTNEDPLLNSFGMRSCDTSTFGVARFAGRSSGCGWSNYDAYISTIGETIERYCPAFFRTESMIKAAYKDLKDHAISPDEFALFSQEQLSEFKSGGYAIQEFTDDTIVYWDKCIDLTNGQTTLCPSAFIYLPWQQDQVPIFYGVSTGLAAHSNFHKSILTSLYEVIERDSFVLTWFQKIVPQKILLSSEIMNYINTHFPSDYQWHFFDMTYDLEIPSIFGICKGRTEYGDFVAVGSATRATKGMALKKVVQEIAQTIPYFRYVLAHSGNTATSDDFSEITNFEQHSTFYILHPSYQDVFTPWLIAQPNTFIDINEECSLSTRDMIIKIVQKLKNLSYNVLVKDLTTVDAEQCGMYCTRVVVPQLLHMTGSYTYYPLGGKRLYEVPSKCGYKSNSFEHLNKFPHPFP